MGAVSLPASLHGLVELPQQVLLAIRQIDGGLHQNPADEIAQDAASYRFDPFATHSKHLARLGPVRNLEYHLAAERGYLELTAQGGRNKSDGDLAVEVVVLPGEDRVLPDVDLDIEVSGRPTLLPGLPFPR